jgi:uncharacterized protein (UPF0332 family)
VSGENIKAAITEELNRADEAFRAAELLFENSLISDAVSKLYYFLLYHVRALLLTKELEPRSHEGALRLFGLHFVKTGIFKPATSHIFSKMMKYREEADYNPAYSFSEDDYKEFRDEVKSVAAECKKYLKSRS